MRATRPALLLALLVIVAVAAPAARARLPEPVPCRGGPCFAPSPGSEWQWQIAGGPARNVAGIELYDVDMFDNRRTDVARLGSDGAAVICYIDVGTVERWRPDVERFRRHPRVIGAPLEDWPGQRWLDIRVRRVVYPIMRDRLDRCARRGYDGAQFDDLDVWLLDRREQGFRRRIIRPDVLRYAAWLANAAHRRGLSAAFENDVEQSRRLEPYYEWLILEECTRYRECRDPGPLAFLAAGKLVGVVEYTDRKRLPPLRRWCSRLPEGMMGLLKRRLLGAWRRPCPPAGG